MLAMRGIVLATLGSAALLWAGCVGGGAFECQQDSDCVDNGPGFCEPAGFCSFADVQCPSGKRYGDFAGSLSGLCVGDEPADAGGTDGSRFDGAPADCSASVVSFEPANVSCAELPSPGDALDVDAFAILDTDAPSLTIGGDPQTISTAVVAQTGGPALLVVTTAQFTLSAGAVLRVQGSRPAVIVSAGDVAIAGEINAGGDNSAPGPGSDHATACATGFGGDGAVQTSANGVAAGTGGGGGAYGGAAAVSPAVLGSGGTDAAGGAANGNAELSPLRGGCHGGAGASPATGGGIAGNAGGALQIVSNATITVAATGVVASPGGGGGGTTASRSGGAGGGSGGAILLEAMDVAIDGAVTANGGGGGEGSRTGFPTNPGQAGHLADSNAASGGTGGSGQGGDGGAGGAANPPEPGLEGGVSMTNTGGTGGGGGSVGRIRFVTHSGTPAMVTGTVSPPAQ